MSGCVFALPSGLTVPPITIATPGLPSLLPVSFNIPMPDLSTGTPFSMPALPALSVSVNIAPIPGLPSLSAVTMSILMPDASLPSLPSLSVLPLPFPIPGLPSLAAITLPNPPCPLD